MLLVERNTFTGTMDDQCAVKNSSGLLPSLLNCSCFLGAVPRLCSLGEILFLCSANLVLQTCTFQLFQLYNCAAKSTFSVLWQRRRRGGEGRAGLIYYSLEMENLTFVPQFLSLQPPPGNTLHILWTLDGVRLVQVERSLQQVSC